MKHTPLIVFLVLLVIVALIVSGTVIFFVNKNGVKENLCLCHGMAGKVCPNTELLSQLYATGQLTENSDLAALQQEMGGPKWNANTSDYAYYNSV